MESFDPLSEWCPTNARCTHFVQQFRGKKELNINIIYKTARKYTY